MGFFVIFILLVIIFFVSRYWIRTYNLLQHLRTECDKLVGNINSVMQQRLDNLFSLIEMVKKYNKHEFTTLSEVIKIRSNPGKTTELRNVILGINALMEQYPNLKANEMFINLMQRDSIIENLLRNARIEFNDALQEYIEAIKQFPSNIVAFVHRFKALKYTEFVKQDIYIPKEIFIKEIE